MREKYCLPIITATPADVLATIQKHHADYGFFEVWLDYLDEVSDAFVTQLAEQYPGQLIFLFRRQKLEPIHMPLEHRLRLLDILGNAPAMVDLDVKSQQAELQRAAVLNVQIIGSYHNYQATPGREELDAITAEIETHHPAIVKLATFCNSETDALRLLSLQLRLKQEGKRHIVLGMSPHGFVTRVFGTLWGNELIFAPDSAGQQSAPGQLSRQQLDAIFAQLAQNS